MDNNCASLFEGKFQKQLFLNRAVAMQRFNQRYFKTSKGRSNRKIRSPNATMDSTNTYRPLMIGTSAYHSITGPLLTNEGPRTGGAQCENRIICTKTP
ncbi:hypothetical protein Y032_0016g3016 [Ancylostoma ceylanicum]|uniref:Uncharacterized protein n=1 Tax=Ancylostoma ceylanicum TaxID=53326 RepID=A0A016V639_9BILA|nr:hypothetical protein Y032_0016g3016 [Ancylostoma ceylanicum]